MDRELPSTRLRMLGRALLVAGKLPILVAEKTPRLESAATVPPGATAEYRRYLARCQRRSMSRMIDEELHALWLYLRSVPAREYGNR